MAIAAAAAALSGVPSASASAAACAAPSGATDQVLAARVIALVNAHRLARGLRAVRASDALERSASWKAWHMARYGYVAHADLPGSRTLAQRLRSCGYRGRGWGEVLAAGQRSPRAVVRAWLASAGHRVVIDTPWWRTVGAGVTRSRRGDLYWAVDFGA